jgi:hypothetical protein
VARTAQKRSASRGQRAAPAGEEVRVCDQCERPLIALDRQEYTTARAELVAERGLCVCPAGDPERLPRRRRSG